MREQARSLCVDLFFVGLVQLVLTIIAQRYLPAALSDDDYARVVLSQRWLNSFQPDPTGSSWLPFPFYLQGGFLWLTSPTLAAARSAAVLSAIFAAMLLYLSARVIGNTRQVALFTTIILMALPLSIWTSIATIPAYLTAALITLAISCASRGGLLFELLAAFCIFLATGSRYEAWPFAIVLSALFSLKHYRSLKSQPYFLIPIGLASGFCVLWLAHGFVIHDDPFFFIQRVRDYKLALNSEVASPSILKVTLKVCTRIWTHFPLACISFALTTCLILIPNLRRQLLDKVWRRQMLALAICSVLPLFLWIGELTDGTPTQHPERALLAFGFLPPLALGALIGKSSPSFRGTWAFFLISGLLVQFVPVETWFPERHIEEEAGHYLATELPKQERILIETPDYGYFAIIAAAGNPKRFKILRSGDPREIADPEKLKGIPPTLRAQNLRAQLEKFETNWAVVSPPLLNPAAAGLQTAVNWGESSANISAYRVRAEDNLPLGGQPQEGPGKP